METQDNSHALTGERDERESTLILSPVARAVLSHENITVQDLKVLYRKLLRRMETVSHANRMESFGGADVRCRQDFVSLPKGRPKDLDSALTQPEHVVADVEHRVTLMERVRFR